MVDIEAVKKHADEFFKERKLYGGKYYAGAFPKGVTKEEFIEEIVSGRVIAMIANL